MPAHVQEILQVIPYTKLLHVFLMRERISYIMLYYPVLLHCSYYAYIISNHNPTAIRC